MWARFGNALDGTTEVRELALGLVKGFFCSEQAVGRCEVNGVLTCCHQSSCLPASAFCNETPTSGSIALLSADRIFSDPVIYSFIKAVLYQTALYQALC